jgi:hypothetical protein
MWPENSPSNSLTRSIAAKASLFVDEKAVDRRALRLMPHSAVLGHGQKPADCN